MKLAAMQPYYLPYLGYFDLIDSVDFFVIFDTPRFQKKTWMNRNRILHPDQNKEFKYLNLNTKQDNAQAACKDVIVPAQNRQLFAQQNLQLYKKMRAVNYTEICDGDFILTPTKEAVFSKFIAEQIKNICSKIGIDTEIVLLSETDYVHEDYLAPGMHAYHICKHFGAKTYVNAPNGRGLFDAQFYHRNGISINFVKPIIHEYRQGRRDFFVPNLSILDVLMFNGLSKFRESFIKYEME